MADGYLRLSSPPTLYIRAPQCNACMVDVEVDGDGMTCPSCGHYWPHEATEDDPGEPPEEDEISGPECPNDSAWLVSGLRGETRDQYVKHYAEEENS